MKNFLTFFGKYKVLIIGLISAVALPVYELIQNGETSKQVLVMSGAIALTSYLARNLRGQWATISSCVGTVLATYFTQVQSGQTVSWAQLIFQFIILFLGASTSPAKSRGYEHTEAIVAAKKEGEQITPTLAPPPPKSV